MSERLRECMSSKADIERKDASTGPQVDRRQTLRALARFAASVAPATVVLLDAGSAHAKQNCSRHPNPKPGQNCDW